MVISLLHYDDDGKKTLGHAITFYVVNTRLSYICLNQEYRYLLQLGYFYKHLGELDRSTMKPIIDGGTEGFKGKFCEIQCT